MSIEFSHVVSLTVAALHLVVGIWSAGLGRHESVFGALARLQFGMFVWNGADVAAALSGNLRFDALDYSAAALTPMLALDFVLTWVGRRRVDADLRRAALLYFGLIAFACALPTVGLQIPWVSTTWSWLTLVGLLFVLPICGLRLFRHLETSVDTQERLRTRFVAAAFVVAAVLAPTDLAQGAGVPRLGALGSGASAVLLLAGLSPGRRRELLLAVLAAAVVCVVVAATFASGPTAAFFWSVPLVLGGFFALLAWPILSDRRERKTRSERLVLQGRMAAQMAHDLKNPLAAIQGAAELLREEVNRGRIDAEHARWLSLIQEQTQRTAAVISRYGRLAEVQLEPRPVEVIAMLNRLQVIYASREVNLDCSAKDVNIFHADPVLLEAALVNLVDNAIEAAQPEQAKVQCTVRPEAQRGEEGVCVTVKDDGPGMDATLAEAVLEDMVTTKATGQGLGLSFARRVAEAHRGNLRLSSRPGQGTEVILWLPIGSPKPEEKLDV